MYIGAGKHTHFLYEKQMEKSYNQTENHLRLKHMAAEHTHDNDDDQTVWHEKNEERRLS